MADTAREFGLSPDEYGLIVQRLNREPNHLELGIFSEYRARKPQS